MHPSAKSLRITSAAGKRLSPDDAHRDQRQAHGQHNDHDPRREMRWRSPMTSRLRLTCLGSADAGRLPHTVVAVVTGARAQSATDARAASYFPCGICCNPNPLIPGKASPDPIAAAVLTPSPSHIVEDCHRCVDVRIPSVPQRCCRLRSHGLP